MIRINLANSIQMTAAGAPGENAEAMNADLQEIQRQGLMRFLMLFLVPLAFYGWEFQKIPSLSAQLRSKNTYLQSLMQKNQQASGAVEEIKKFKEDQSRLQKQIDTLEGLQRERLREVKILDNLQKDIPDKVWLTRLEFQDSKLLIAGNTVADLDLSIFMENLSKSVFLKEVNLVKSLETKEGTKTIKKFEISCTIDRPVLNAEVKR